MTHSHYATNATRWDVPVSGSGKTVCRIFLATLLLACSTAILSQLLPSSRPHQRHHPPPRGVANRRHHPNLRHHRRCSGGRCQTTTKSDPSLFCLTCLLTPFSSVLS